MSRHKATVRFSRASTTAPIAVADFEGLPADAREALPSTEVLQSVIAEERTAWQEQDGHEDTQHESYLAFTYG